MTHAWNTIQGLLWRAADAEAATTNLLSVFKLLLACTSLCAAHARLEDNKGLEDSVHRSKLCHTTLPSPR